MRRSEHSRDQARTARDQVRRGRPRRDILQDSAFARLQVQMATMAVIEQAKGIMMAQQGCGPEQAFDLLRHASQRANLKVHLMAQIIAHGHLGQRVLEPRPELAEQVERVRRTAGPYRWYSMAAPRPCHMVRPDAGYR